MADHLVLAPTFVERFTRRRGRPISPPERRAGQRPGHRPGLSSSSWSSSPGAPCATCCGPGAGCSRVALDILEPVLAGLGAAHRAGFVHRDMKPENVLIGVDGLVKVADFGLVRSVPTPANQRHRRRALGTVSYLSPEQLEQPGRPPLDCTPAARPLRDAHRPAPYAGDTPGRGLPAPARRRPAALGPRAGHRVRARRAGRPATARATPATARTTRARCSPSSPTCAPTSASPRFRCQTGLVTGGPRHDPSGRPPHSPRPRHPSDPGTEVLGEQPSGPRRRDQP